MKRIALLRHLHNLSADDKARICGALGWRWSSGAPWLVDALREGARGNFTRMINPDIEPLLTGIERLAREATPNPYNLSHWAGHEPKETDAHHQARRTLVAALSAICPEAGAAMAQAFADPAALLAERQEMRDDRERTRMLAVIEWVKEELRAMQRMPQPPHPLEVGVALVRGHWPGDFG